MEIFTVTEVVFVFASLSKRRFPQVFYSNRPGHDFRPDRNRKLQLTGTGTEIINLPGPGPIISILPGPGPTIQFYQDGDDGDGGDDGDDGDDQDDRDQNWYSYIESC